LQNILHWSMSQDGCNITNFTLIYP